MLPSAPPTPFALLRHFWRVVGVRPIHLVWPLVLLLFAAACEAASLALLVPLTDAIKRDSFDFLGDSRAFSWILMLVPPTDEGATSTAVTLILITFGLIIVGRIGKLAFEYARTYYVVSRNERYGAAIGAETFARVLSFGRQYFDRQSIGTTDAQVSWTGAVISVLLAAEESVRFALFLLIKAGVMAALSLPLSIAFLLTLPFVTGLLRTVDRRVSRIATDLIDAHRNVRSRILDILGSIPLIKLNSQETEAARTYVDALHEARHIAIRRERVHGLRYPLEEVVVLLVMFVVQGAVMLWAGSFSPGDLASFGAFLFVVQQALPDYVQLSRCRIQIVEEWPRLRALAGLFSDEGKYIVPAGTRAFQGVEQHIRVEQLTFAYEPGAPVLHEVSVTFDAGAVTAIVGQTGAGKTTLVDLIARLYDCPPGSMFIDGVDIRAFSLASLHARMALVSQDVWLLNRSLRDNLTFGLARTVTDDELMVALDDVDLADFVAELRDGLATNIGDRGVQLSGGQRQRVALARALLRDPDILILDEATSALDSVVEQRVARTIQRRAAGRTLIVIAHRLSTIRDADRIVVMHHGRVVEQGTWTELTQLGGRFAQLQQAQFAPAADP